MIIYDWIWTTVVIAITGGTVAYCLALARSGAEEELKSLREKVAYERKRKKYWKAIAKGKTTERESIAASDSRAISLSSRLNAASGTA
jgi:hypothetical protein